MANRIKIARGSQNNLPTTGADSLLYGELFWAKEQSGVTDGVLFMGHPDGVEDGVNEKAPLPIAGARAMKSLYFEGLWDPSLGTYPSNPEVGSFWIASKDGVGATNTFHYGDWAICITVNPDGSTQWIKSINQAITTENPLNLQKNPLDLTSGVISLKYDGNTLTVDSSGNLILKTYESFNLASGVTIDNYKVVAIDSTGAAILADYSAEATAGVVGFAIGSDAVGTINVQKTGRITNPAWLFADVGGPVYLDAAGGLLQDLSIITPSSSILIQVGTAVTSNTVEINIGTPFIMNLPSDLAYIPIVNSVTKGDITHAPTADAVYNLMSGSSAPTFSNIIPSRDNMYDVGSPEFRFANVYANEIHVGEHSVYIGDEELVDDPVLGFGIVNSSLPPEQQVVKKVITGPDLNTYQMTGLTGFGANVTVVDALNSLQSKAVYTGVTSINGVALNVAGGDDSNYWIIGHVPSNLGGASNNLGIGWQAAASLTGTATNNLAIGVSALENATSAVYNIAIGNFASNAITSGGQNIVVGHGSFNIATIANGNVVVGHAAALAATTAQNNTIIGMAAGQALTTGINNIIIGYNAAASAANANNEITLGNSSITTLRVGTSTIWTSSSGVILTGPVAIDFLPDGNNLRALGSATKRFTDVYSYKGDFSDDVAIGGDLVVTGDLTVNGNTSIINTTQVNIADNMIQVNSNQTGAPASSLVGGIEINRGTSTNYELVFVEAKECFQIGQAGQLQSVATREDAPISNAVPFWNNTATRFDTSSALTFNSTTGALSATKFVGDGNSLTNLPAATASVLGAVKPGTGLSVSGGALSVNTSQSITTLSNFTVAGYIKTDANGLLSSVDIPAADLPSVYIGTTSVDLSRASGTMGLAGITGLGIRDTSAAFDVTLGCTSSVALTGARTLTVDVVNGARTIKLGGNLTINSGAGLTVNTNPGTIAFSSGSLTLTVSGNASVSGTNTGDQTGLAAGAGTVGFINYNALTAAAGQFNGGTTAPSNTNRLNYEGYLYATKLYGDGSGLSNIAAAALTAGYGDTTNPYASKTANYVLAAPNGSSGVPSFRALVAADISNLSSAATGITSVGTITTGTWSGSFGAVSGANLTSLTAGNLSGTIPSAVLGNSTVYVGTTAIALNRASASQTLSGVSIDGNAGSVSISYNNTSASNYQILFGSGNGVYGCAAITMNPSTGAITATTVNNAVWNDIADCIEVPNDLEIEFGKVYVMNEDGTYNPSTGYLAEGIIGIASDTYGIGVGRKEGKKELPIAIGGFVLAHVDKKYRTGTPLTAGPDGSLTEIALADKRDYPERIVATFWKTEPDTNWNGVDVKGRSWVKVI